MWTSTSNARPAMTRRAFVSATAGLIAAGCTQSTPRPQRGPARDELEFWAWVPGMDKVVELWNARRPDLPVRFVRVPAGGDGGYAKLYAGLEAGIVPDLMQVEFQELPAMVLNDAVLDLSQYGIAEHRELFVGWAYDQANLGGGVYGVPQASGPVGLFYRKDLFDEWGIRPPETWDEYERAAEIVRRRDAYLVTFPVATPQYLPAMCWQNGSIWFSADDRNWLVDIDNPATYRVVDYWQRLVERDLVDTIQDDGNAWFKSLQDGRIASVIGAQWHAEIIAGNAANTSGKWAVARVPQWSDATRLRSSNMGGSAVSVVRGSRQPEAAMEFAMWLNTDPEAVSALVDNGAGYPTLADVSRVDALKRPWEFFDGQRIGDVFAEASEGIDNRWRWLPTANQAVEYMTTRTEQAISASESFRTVAADLQQQVLRDLDKKGLPYRAL